MSRWSEPTPELEWQRRMRDLYTDLVNVSEECERLDELWLSERRRNNAFLEEAREIRTKVQSVGTMTGSIPLAAVAGLLELLEQHDKEMAMPF
jgi:hypothetical protein